MPHIGCKQIARARRLKVKAHLAHRTTACRSAPALRIWSGMACDFRPELIKGESSMRTQLRFMLFVAVPVAAGCMTLAGCSSSATPTPAAATPAHSPSARAVTAAPLSCDASVTSKHPGVHTAVGVRVRTARRARITAVAHYRLSTVTHRHRADGSGRHTICSKHGRKGYCGTWFSPPRPVRVSMPAPSPSAPAPAPSPSTSAVSCHPLTSGGNCYEPGEFCSDADHGMSGVAGNGEPITCTDNNGWRWEPA